MAIVEEILYKWQEFVGICRRERHLNTVFWNAVHCVNFRKLNGPEPLRTQRQVGSSFRGKSYRSSLMLPINIYTKNLGISVAVSLFEKYVQK